MLWRSALSLFKVPLTFAVKALVFGGWRGLTLRGRLFEQQGEEATQPVLGVGRRVAVYRHYAEFAGGFVSKPRLCPAVGFFQVAVLAVY